MRYRIKEYELNDTGVIISGRYNREDIRLVIDETQECVICSSMTKRNVQVSYDKEEDVTYIIVEPNALVKSNGEPFEKFNEGDEVTIEVDKGDSVDVDLSPITEKIAELHDKVKEEVKTEYQYAFVQNADDMDTYTMILPTSAVVDDETINL